MQTYSSATTVSLGICYFGTCGWSPVSARMILTCGSFGWIYLTICKASLMCKLILLSAVCIQKPNRDKGLQILLGGTSVPVKCISTAFFFFFFWSCGALVVITAFPRGWEGTPQSCSSSRLWGVLEGCLKPCWQLWRQRTAQQHGVSSPL